MSDRRRFLKGLTSLPLDTVLANTRLAAAVSAGLEEVEAKLADGRTVKAALAWVPAKRGKRSQRSSDKENNKPNERYAAMTWV